MIALIIDGKPAALRRDASFQMILENREFDDRDGYSLSIELPLRECPENVAIFGHLLSSQIPIENIRLDASLWLDSWVKNGVVTIVSVGKSSVSVQFLEGRCAQNFDKTLDKIYINELELGGYGDMTNRDNITPEEAWKVVANGYYPSHVCLPWVSNSSGIKYNDAEYVGGEWVWKDPILPEDPDEETTSQDWITLEQSRKLTWQIYLMELTRRICEAVGLTPDLSKWPTKKKTLVVCNTLPPVYELYGWADILPHWSVKEFFANLEPLLQGYFDIDLRAKSIVFVPFAPEDKKLTEITPDKLIAEFSVDVSADEKSAKYRSNKNLKYADSSSDNLWPLLTCGKPLEEWPQSKVQNFGSLLAMMAWSQNYKSTDFTKAMKQRGSSTPLNRIARF